MRLFDETTAELLRPYLLDQCIGSLLLTTYGLAIHISDISIHCNERVFVSIEGKDFEWDESPSRAPWGLLVRQIIAGVRLAAPDRLRIDMASGDYIEIETSVNPYESVVIDFPKEDDKLVMEIF